MDSSIAISNNEFKALASETRTEMIKLLRERNHTLTELSKKLDMAAPTIKQHLGILQQAGLIEGLDEGRKWKYYTLTRKGKNIFATEAPANVLIVLAISAVVMVGLLYGLLLTVGFQAPGQMLQAESRAPTITEAPNAVPCIGPPAGGEKEAGKSDNVIGITAVDQNAPEAASGIRIPVDDINADKTIGIVSKASRSTSDKNAFEIIGVERQPTVPAAAAQCNTAQCPSSQCPLLQYSEPPLLKIAALVAAIVIVAVMIGFTASKARKQFR
jgi:DNA-binding transcriptional ArsR family regulator